MRRFAIVAVLLLPLPFAAIPVVSVLFAGGGNTGVQGLAVLDSAPRELSVEADIPAATAANDSMQASYSWRTAGANGCPAGSGLIEG